MVVAAFSMRAERAGELAALGVRDSKVLSPKRREALASALASLAEGVHYVEIPPADLDRANLNDLELAAFAACVKALAPDAVYADAPVGPRGIPRFRARLAEAYAPLAPDLVLENRADARFPVVSAASILAKVRRDARIAELALRYGEIGSGYPSDPKTRAFLAAWMDRHGAPPPFARAKWATFARLKQERFDF